jgi:transketolase
MKLKGPYDVVYANSRPYWHDALEYIGGLDKNIIALTADLSRSVATEKFRKTYPDRFFNVGIAEQDMIGLAAGLALNGKIPYCCSFAPFLTMRALEQFRTDVCYMNLNVRMIGAYGGIAAAGPTHAGLEDAGIIRGLANATVVCPSDVSMVKKMFEASVKYKGPMYIRMWQGAKESDLYDEDYTLEIGKAIEAREGNDVTIISFGVIMREAVVASNALAEEGIKAGIIDMHTLKPIDKEAILKAAKHTGRIVTVEDHSLFNGLGSAVAETLMDAGVSCKLKRLGIPDIYPIYGDNPKLYARGKIIQVIDFDNRA